MAVKRKRSRKPPQPKLDMKLIEKFLRDYKRMPYKDKTSIMAALLILMAIPLGFMYASAPKTPTTLDVAPLDIAPATECYVTGCLDQLCLDHQIDTPTTSCEPQPQYQCLEFSRCEVQDSGYCGWTETPEYLSCLDDL